MSQRIVMIDTVALTGIYGNGPPNDNIGNPPDSEYAKLMWKWIEKTLSEVDSILFSFTTNGIWSKSFREDAHLRERPRKAFEPIFSFRKF